jgi:hypothetical protein
MVIKMEARMEAKARAAHFEDRSITQRTELEKLTAEVKRLEKTNEGLSTRLKLCVARVPGQC